MTTRPPGSILCCIVLTVWMTVSCSADDDQAGTLPSGPATPPTVAPPPSTNPLTPGPTAVPTTVIPTTAPAPATTAISEVIHVFPIDPPDAASYSPGGHAYPATDLFAPEGTRFVAVTSGVVEGVSRVDRWDPDVNDGANRAGLFVSLIGDDGVRYYGSHLSEVADGIDAGSRVEAGELLGFVGRSGNARATPPHLHFGISHPTFLDDWEVRRGEIDPVPFLDAWRSGDTGATPDL